MAKLLFFICFFLVAIYSPLLATYIPVYTINTNGGLSFTGNTLGLNKAANQNQPGTSGAIGAFITTDISSQVGSYPVGTTLDWTTNSSSAVLDIPSNSTILYAELIWSGSYGFGDTIPLNSVDVPITLITPDAVSHSISPNPATAQSRVQADNTGFYVRSADVTSLISNLSGTYTVGGVPATVIATENNLNCAGWTLAVAYTNTQMLTSNLTIFVGCEASGASPALVNGFQAPSLGNITSVLFASSLEGDAALGGDHFLIGATTPLAYPDNAISGPNNPSNNFFGSQINTTLPLTIDPLTGKLSNNGSATLDTRGSFGTTNSNILTGTNVSGARQGYDITAIDIGSFITNNQTQFYAQGTTAADVYTVNALGLQIQILAPVIQSVLQVDQTTISLNSVVTYTSTFTNIGEAAATSLVFTDVLPAGLTFVPNSLAINGIPVPGADIVSGVPLGNLPVNDSVIVTFQAIVTQFNPPNSFDNASNVSYSFVPLNSSAPTVGLNSQTNTVTISGAVVPPPVANPDAESMGANSVLSGLNVLTNDTGSNLFVSAYDVTSVQGGSVVIQPNGVYTYNPPNNFSGTDSFNYTITDSLGQTASTTVTITVFPVATNDTSSVAANTPLNQITSVLVNDIGTGLTVSTSDNQSAQGGIVAMQANGTYTYSPPLNFSGIDTFNYTVMDTAGNTAIGVVTIRVLPVAEDDVGITPANTMLNGSTVFTNDVGTGLILVAYDSTSAQGGQIVMNMTNGTYTYTPPLNFSGIDTFTYTVQDQAGEQSVSTVTITVLPIAVNDTGSTTANTPFNQTTSVLNNDLGSGLTIQSYNALSIQGGSIVMQANGDYMYTPPLNFSGPDAFSYIAKDTAENITTAQVNLSVLPLASPDNETTKANTPFIGASVLNNDAGTNLTIQNFQSISNQGGSVIMNVNGTYAYSPPLNFSGTDTFTYTAIDFYGNPVTASVIISVQPIINNPIFSTNANDPFIDNVLLNDVGSDLTVVPLHQATSLGGMVNLMPNGTFSYIPPHNFSGTDSFTYIVVDGSGNMTTAIASIIVLPVAVNDKVTTSMNIPLTGHSLLANDEGSNLTIFSYTPVSQNGGKVVMNLQTGIYTYFPPLGFKGIDTFSYTIIDGEGRTSSATVIITVSPVTPPLSFEGKIKKYEFLNQNDYKLKMAWQSSISPDVVAYHIYYKKKLIAKVCANQRLVFEKCISSAKAAKYYSITAVNSGGAESAPVNIRVNNE